MNIYSSILTIQTKENMELVDVTPLIQKTIIETGVTDGLAIVSSRHTTTALFINEYEQRLEHDIKEFFQQLVPADKKYLHNDIHLRDCPADEPENAHSHIMAMLLSSSETIPVIDGALAIGQWQSVLFAEMDGPRSRTLNVQLIGNSSNAS